MNTLSIGIDVGKQWLFLCALSQDGQLRETKFANDPAAFKKLESWIRLHESPAEEVRVCLESTGCYGRAVATYLVDRGYKVSVENPRTIKHFAISLSLRNKTDRVDARTIARYALERNPRLWHLADPVRREILELLEHISRLDAMKCMAGNPLEDTALAASVTTSSKALLGQFLALRKEALARIKVLVACDEELTHMVKALVQIRGIGFKTAVHFVARVDVRQFESAEAAAAYAGLNPCQRQSGKQVWMTVLSRQGDAALRKAFYMPAKTAMRWNETIRTFRERLLARGKRKSSARAACMRKLLMICFGVAKAVIEGREPVYGG